GHRMHYAHFVWNSTSRCDSRLCTCTIIAMANSGVARLTIGIETNTAISRPARKTWARWARRIALASPGRAEAHRRQQEVFPAKQVGVGEEHDGEAGSRDEQER